MVMRSYCLDFLARRGETPHQENISLSSTTWTLKHGQEKQTDPSYQNKPWGVLGYALEPQLANLKTNVHGGPSPSSTPPIQFLHPRLREQGRKDCRSRRIRKPAAVSCEFVPSRRNREPTSMKLLQYGRLSKPWRMIPPVSILTWMEEFWWGPTPRWRVINNDLWEVENRLLLGWVP